MRKGFSLLTAILFLVLVATISVLALSLSTQSAKQTSDIFLKTQAELLAKSSTEYALLAMSGHDYVNDGCLNDINARYNSMFDINITINYIGNGLPAGCNILDNNLTTNDSNRTVIIDTVVTSKSDITTEPIRIHRRTIQKP